MAYPRDVYAAKVAYDGYAGSGSEDTLEDVEETRETILIFLGRDTAHLKDSGVQEKIRIPLSSA